MITKQEHFQQIMRGRMKKDDLILSYLQTITSQLEQIQADLLKLKGYPTDRIEQMKQVQEKGLMGFYKIQPQRKSPLPRRGPPPSII